MFPIRTIKLSTPCKSPALGGQEKHLVELRKAVLEQQKADIGIALDGDGDRLVLIDECGTIISADQALSLFAEICLKAHPGHEVVFDRKSLRAQCVNQRLHP